MGREVKRVPIPFNWPLEKVWGGYMTPEHLIVPDCPDCHGSGESPDARRLHDRWYGQVSFDPAETGSEPYTSETPVVRARAERNVADAPQYYTGGVLALQAEAQRLADLFNARWMHHLAQEDVDALIDDGRLRDFTHTWSRGDGWAPKDPPYRPTAREVNLWSLSGMGHDSINCWVVVAAACERAGVSSTCATCGGNGAAELWPGQMAAREAWEWTEPPTGEGWQLWETVSEGSPITPAFATAAELVEHLVTVGDAWGQKKGRTWDREAAERIVESKWAPSLIVDSAGVHTPENARSVGGSGR